MTMTLTLQSEEFHKYRFRNYFHSQHPHCPSGNPDPSSPVRMLDERSVREHGGFWQKKKEKGSESLGKLYYTRTLKKFLLSSFTWGCSEGNV